MKKTLFSMLLAVLMLISQIFAGFAIANPFVEYKSLSEAKKAVDFDVYTPQLMELGYEQVSVNIIDGKILQLIFSDGKNEICFRTAKGASDLSGDYNKYPEKKTVTISGIKVTVKGSGGKISVATFTVNKISYSFTFTDAVTLEALTLLIETLDFKGGAATSVINPIVEYKTLKKATDAVKFKAKTPLVIPVGYKRDKIAVIDNTVLQITYSNGKNEICFRTAKGTDDISGDYNAYKQTKSVMMSGIKVRLKGANDKVSLATWTDSDAAYALSFSEGAKESDVKKIVSGVK